MKHLLEDPYIKPFALGSVFILVLFTLFGTISGLSEAQRIDNYQKALELTSQCIKKSGDQCGPLPKWKDYKTGRND